MASILDQVPPMEIEGNYYKYNRLGLEDIPKILEMVCLLTTEGFQHLQIRLGFLRELTQLKEEDAHGMLGMLTMAFGVQEIKDKFFDFIVENVYKTDEKGKANNGRLTKEELMDKQLFPAYSLCHLVLYLVMHPDVILLRDAVEAGTSIPFFRRALEEVSSLSQVELKDTLAKINEEEKPEPTIS